MLMDFFFNIPHAFGHVMLNRYVCVINFTEYVWALCKRWITGMSQKFFTDNMRVLEIVVLLTRQPINVVKFLIRLIYIMEWISGS